MRPFSHRRSHHRSQFRPVAALRSLALLPLVLAMLAAPALGQSRIKDIADFEGVRDNLLVGYGLVVGLDGTGDDLGSAVFTRESLIGVLQRLGVNARDPNLDTDNVAAVMVTSNLPPFARQGSRIDISVHAIGDAESLLGGTLLVTPMLGADGEVYAVAQGPIAVAGFSAQGAAQSVTKGVPTAGRIANGAIIERELGFELEQLQSLKVTLRNPDFTTARRVAEAINGFVGLPAAASTDPGTVVVNVPPNYAGDTVGMITDIEQLTVRADQVARVVIDEASGVIVMGENVRISTVAIAQGQPHDPHHRDAAGQPALALLQHRHDDRGAAHADRGHGGSGSPSCRAAGRRQPAGAGERSQRARYRAAGHDHDPAGHQGRGRAPGRDRGAVMSPLSAPTLPFGQQIDPVREAWSSTRDKIETLTRAAGGKLGEAEAKRIHKMAEDFEAVFLEQMLSPMFESLETDGLFGGGSGERMYRSLLVGEYGKALARSGGVGIADAVTRQVLALQEVET